MVNLFSAETREVRKIIKMIKEEEFKKNV